MSFRPCDFVELRSNSFHKQGSVPLLLGSLLLGSLILCRWDPCLCGILVCGKNWIWVLQNHIGRSSCMANPGYRTLSKWKWLTSQPPGPVTKLLTLIVGNYMYSYLPPKIPLLATCEATSFSLQWLKYIHAACSRSPHNVLVLCKHCM